jgi:hypothetical protein
VEDTIDAWDSNEFYTRVDGSGKSRQDEISVEEKNYVPDFTTGGLSDIFISVEGLYDQTLTWGFGLISVETAAAPGSEASVRFARFSSVGGGVLDAPFYGVRYRVGFPGDAAGRRGDGDRRRRGDCHRPLREAGRPPSA